ncbi:GTPase Era [bacterium MnTg02]|nr:GTPase Era [bacterium MnTg02]
MVEGKENQSASAERGAQRCGFVALVGAPNAGKSTLTNRMVGVKVAIVTHKAQTTRARIRAIVIEGQTQIILVDTPGIFEPKRRLDRAMVGSARDEAKDADIVVLLIDAAKGLDESAKTAIKVLTDLRIKLVLCLNKIDRLRKEALLALTKEVTGEADFGNVFMISALNGSGVDDLRHYLAEALPEGPWLYPEDQIADIPLRMSAAEITREKIYLRLHDELPYSSTVETTGWKSLKDGSIRIEQTIYIERDSQKKIVLGKSGQTIKKISMEAREDIGEMVGGKVHLFLFVKVRGRWAEDPERYREMGLEFPKS